MGVPCGHFPSKLVLLSPRTTEKKLFTLKKNKEEEQFCEFAEKNIYLL